MTIIKRVFFSVALFVLSACSTENCYPANKLAEYAKDGDDCWLCPVFRIFFNTVSQIAAKANDEFCKPVAIVVAVAFAVWLAIFALKYLTSMETRDVKDLLQEIVVKGFQVILVVCILNFGATNFYKLMINPVYETALKGGQAAFNDDSVVITGRTSVDNIKNGLPDSMGNAIVKIMITMEKDVSQIRALGSGLICYGWKEGFIIPKFKYMIPGLVFWILAMASMFIIPLLMIDVVFELAVAVALLPAAIGCYPFKPTRKYTQKVWDSFLNSAFSFLFVSLVVVLLLGVMKATVMDLPKNSSKDLPPISWDDIMTDTTEGKMDEYVSRFGWWMGNILDLVFVFVLSWTVMNMGKEFADEFASSISNTNLGGSIGKIGLSAVKGIASKTLKPTAGRIKDNIMGKAQGKAQNFARKGSLGKALKSNSKK